jgi:hypothetical protein
MRSDVQSSKSRVAVLNSPLQTDCPSRSAGNELRADSQWIRKFAALILVKISVKETVCGV